MLLNGCAPLEVQSTDFGSANESLVIENWTDIDAGTLHFIEAGNPIGIPLVFIHGTPGSLGFFKSYLTDPKLQHFRTIAIDRPGWGQSKITEQFEPTLSYQAKALGNWLCQIKTGSIENKLFIAAHSYGATLTPKLIIEYPECISGALLLAGAADPALAPPRWYNILTHYTPVSWLVSLSSKELKRSNNEMMRVESELKLIQDDWHTISVPITVIQGEEDGLVHPDNADFIEAKLSHIPAKIIRIEGGGHVLRSSHRDLIVSEINSLLESVSD